MLNSYQLLKHQSVKTVNEGQKTECFVDTLDCVMSAWWSLIEVILCVFTRTGGQIVELANRVDDCAPTIQWADVRTNKGCKGIYTHMVKILFTQDRTGLGRIVHSSINPSIQNGGSNFCNPFSNQCYRTITSAPTIWTQVWGSLINCVDSAVLYLRPNLLDLEVYTLLIWNQQRSCTANSVIHLMWYNHSNIDKNSFNIWGFLYFHHSVRCFFLCVFLQSGYFLI